MKSSNAFKVGLSINSIFQSLASRVKDIIRIENMSMKFGDFTAVNNISLEVHEGEIFGLLGPNGAGKTTTINVLLSLLKPTSGRVIIDGLDLSKHNEEIKQKIGMLTQETVVEGDLTARENLEIFARLYHLKKDRMEKAIDAALDEADLEKFANVKAGTFSGGMQRRLALVKAMLYGPKILILDEPTTGLDVQNRHSMWKHIRELNDDGTTIILTTQYLEEADALCDRLAIIDHGKIIAKGSPSDIKSIAGKGDILEVMVEPAQAELAADILKEKLGITCNILAGRLTSVIEVNRASIVGKAMAALEKNGVEVLSASIRLPSLDDVFIKLTGAVARDETGENKMGVSAAMTRTRFM